jgi:hypothetical protein
MRPTTTLPGSSLLLALGVAASAAHAQQRDTIPTHVDPDAIPVLDTVPVVPYEPPSTGRLLLGTARSLAFMTAGAFATSGVLLLPDALRITAGDTTEASFPEGRSHAWIGLGTGPGLGPHRRADWSGAADVGLETMLHGIRLDARWEHARLDERLEIRTAHLGWLAHPRRGVMGGVVVGYRDARGPGMLRGVDFGFPLVVAIRGGGWLAYQPSYVVSPGGRFVMSYRIESVPPRAATRPFFPTMVLEARGFGENDGMVTVGAQFGVRTRMR